MFRRIKGILLIIFLILLILLILKRPSFLGFNFKSLENVIVVDAGHGGNDSGAIGVMGSYEKDVNLEIAKKLKEKLDSNGYKVILTRDSDEYVENNLRAKLANRKRARIFISIHANAVENNNSINGVQVLYYPNRESTTKDLNNNEFASIMMDSLISGTSSVNKGIIERKDLIVLNQTKMPAIIVETGFLTNSKEEKLLLTDDYQNRIVNSISEGIERYFSLNLNK
ncbi:N-acetylmuramoyl-L-alanine amidase family protein [Senegalia sp. (in: firmicutes)]|uniref:N-acetylmuramoyl-L-alanine amidase family protein n=1 Tax=Senegalia sp. (in: firmicutes) TaxID=1924098 RepID=UPI003F99D137